MLEKRIKPHFYNEEQVLYDQDPAGIDRPPEEDSNIPPEIWFEKEVNREK